MCSSQIEEWAKYENSWQKTERGCEGDDRVTGVTGVTLEKKKLVKEKKNSPTWDGQTDNKGKTNGCWKAEMSKNIVQGTTHQSVDRLRQ